MTKLITLAAAIGVSFFCVAFIGHAARTAPTGKGHLTIPVAGGCGPGFHRGPYGGCRRNYVGGTAAVPGELVVRGLGPPAAEFATGTDAGGFANLMKLTGVPKRS